MPTKVRVAVIGAGFIAHYHVKGLLEQENVEITAICDTAIEKAQEFAKIYNIKQVYEKHSDLIRENACDAVILCLPNALHVPIASDFVRAGKDVFIEKPLGINTEEGEQLKETMMENNRLVMIGHMWRFDEQTRFVRAAIAAGEIGEVLKTKGCGIHVDWGPQGWFTQKNWQEEAH